MGKDGFEKIHVHNNADRYADTIKQRRYVKTLPHALTQHFTIYRKREI